MKKVVACALSAVIALTAAVPAALANSHGGNTIVYASQVFIDLDGYDWARDAIGQFVQSGIVQGVGNGRFAPNDLVTREQFAKMLTLTYGASTAVTPTPTFADVGQNRWSYPYIEACTDYLTAYPNPTGGKLFFRPNEAATREDIAVALVKMMGLSETDVKDSNFLDKSFSDAATVSPKLRNFITVAAEYGLLEGYADGSFRPQQGITRAEAVVLLSRSTKIAVGADNGKIPADAQPAPDESLELVASVIHGSRGGDVTIYVEAAQGTRVTVEGQEIIMSQTKPGYAGGSYQYYFKKEDSKLFTVTGKKGNKTRTITVTASYQIDAPLLTISECPEATDQPIVTIKGYVHDKKDPSPSVLVNDKPASIGKDGRWTATVELKSEGAHTIRIVAGNHMGKETMLTRSVTCTPVAPTLTITECPSRVTRPRVEIKGNVADPFDSVTVTINGMTTKRDGKQWKRIMDLHEGKNTFVVTAVNSVGKMATEECVVYYEPVTEPVKEEKKPERINLKWVETDADPDDCQFQIFGTVNMVDGQYPTVTVNGINARFISNGTWRADCPIAEWKAGKYDFKIIATLPDGRREELTKIYRIYPEDIKEPDDKANDNDNAETTEPPLVEFITPDGE